GSGEQADVRHAPSYAFHRRREQMRARDFCRAAVMRLPSPIDRTMPQTLVTAYIALGANLGNREQNIRAAVRALDESPDVKVVLVSSLLENPAIGGPKDSPPFLNAAAEIHTTISPIELLQRLLEIEKNLGRVRREKWAPRLIDLDLLLYGDEIIDTPELKIPHPLMHERR